MLAVATFTRYQRALTSVNPYIAGVRRPRIGRVLHAMLMVCLAMASGACRDSAGPERGVDVELTLTLVDGPTISLRDDQRISVSCRIDLLAQASGVGRGTWEGGTLRLFAGRDRSEALDTLQMSAADAASFWSGAEITAGDTQTGRFVVSASVPFEIAFAFEYRPTERGKPRMVEASFECGPTLAEDAVPPAVTALAVRPVSGVVEPGDAITIDYSALSEIGLVQAVVDIAGACEVSDTTPILLEQSIVRSVAMPLPHTCTVGEAITVSVTVFDGALEVASRELTRALTIGDETPPTIAPSFVPRISPDGTPNPEGDYFVGDTIRVFFNALDNTGIAALIWEAGSSGIRDSIPVGLGTPNPLKIPVRATWGSDPGRLRLYARDRVGLMSAVYTSPQPVRVHPTIVRPVRSTGVSGAIFGMAIDSDRGIVYLMQTDEQRIAIFSLATMSVTGYVALGTHLADLDLTPGGDSLIVALPAQRALGVIDLRGPTPSVSTIPVTVLDPIIKDLPVRVRALGGGRLIVALEGTAQVSRRVAEVNLGTNSQFVISDPAFAGGWEFERSHDRSAVVFTGIEDRFQRYDVPTNQFGPSRSLPPQGFALRPSLDARGERIALRMTVYDRALLPVSEAFRLPGTGVYPSVISPDGEFLYAGSMQDGLIRYRVTDGSIVDRSPNPVRPEVVKVTSDGKWVITHGIGGISVFDMR